MKITNYSDDYNINLSGGNGVATYNSEHVSLGSNTPLVESGSGSPGTGPQASAWNHVHPALAGSTSFGSNSNSVSSANAPGASSSNSRADHVHRGVATLAKSGSTGLVGDVTLTAGSNVTLTQSGNDISIASTGGGGGGSGAATAIRYPVQASAGGSSSSLTRAVTITAASTSNKLIVVTLNEGTFAVSSIACTNVTFAKLAGTTIGTAPVIEIWIGTISGSPSGTTVTVTFAGTTFCNATVMEWASLAGTLDTSATRNVSTDATGAHPIPLLTPGNTGSVVIAAASATNNSTQFSSFSGPYFVFATVNSTLGVAWGFPGTNPVYGIFNGGSNATASGITASIL